MPKFYCDYCKSYITHDAMSVRKSHLSGRNHVKYYCDYYAGRAKEEGIWDPNELPYEMTLSKLNTKIPDSQSKIEITSHELYSLNDFELPPPPALAHLPNPPPSVVNLKDEYKKGLAEILKK